MRKSLIVLVLLTLLQCPGPVIHAAPLGDPVLPGSIQVDATFEHLGAVWWIEGDQDLNSQLTLEFRRIGETSWHPGAPAVRAYPDLYVHDGPLGLNYWAASAMFLQPGSTYELRLTLTDPDGGGGVQTLIADTRSWPAPDPAGRERHVIPGTGGGDGSAGDPYRGLQAAAEAALPGDRFQLAPGTYAPFQLLTGGTPEHPITFQGPPAGEAVIDGGGTDRAVITVGEYDQTIEHVILAGLTIQNGHWGVDLQHSREIYLHHNRIQDVDDGVVNRRGAGLEANQTVCDNTILGRTPWPGSGIPSERGVDLKGTGNVVCHNTVRRFGDCISVQPSTGPSFGNDVYGNDVSYCVDDGIEVDYNQANVRAWRNRVMNARMGVSLQPIRGGPAYVFRNEFFNLESVPLKMHNHTTGFYVAHNTGAKHANGHGDNGAMWRNAVFRNNLFLGTRYAFEFTTIADEGFRDLDYNAWGTTRQIDPGGPFFKWDNVRYDTLADLPPGVEDHGLTADFSDLVFADLPGWWDVEAIPGSRDLRLIINAPEIDSGAPLPNLNDSFVTDGQPDMGAHEYGQGAPNYGPRPQSPDLSPSEKHASHPAPHDGEVVTYTLSLQNIGAPLTQTVTLTDTIPVGLEYQPGSAQASGGTFFFSGARTLVWTGLLDGATTVILSYQARVEAQQPAVLTNHALLTAGTEETLVLQATIIANGRTVALPLIRRD